MDAYRQAILNELGIERWVLRAYADPAPSEPPVALEAGLARTNEPRPIAQNLSRSVGSQARPVAAAQRQRTQAAVESTRTSPPPADKSTHSIASHPEVASLPWPQLQATVAECQRCELAGTRTQTVFGAGDPQAALMLVGDAPGFEEDASGAPFAGANGELLARMLAAIGLQREAVYIANIIKCRPPNDRAVMSVDVTACGGYLYRQIELVKPKLIVCVGRVAAHHVLGVESPLNQLRGQAHVFKPLNIPVIVTYHPGYLLRAPREKAKAWQDLKKIQARLAELTPSVTGVSG
jgi:uracil-DNA glycosylase